MSETTIMEDAEGNLILVDSAILLAAAGSGSEGGRR
jgi:hypothetical protein